MMLQIARIGLLSCFLAIGATAAVAQSPPFSPLNDAQQNQLDALLRRWQEESQDTKQLRCKFTRWQFNPAMAPANVHATWATGELKYAAPDKGLFRVDNLLFFTGVDAESGEAKYEAIPGRSGEWWVCNGQELMEFDRDQEVCTVTSLPPDMQGQQILESPLPFVFNLDAAKIKKRYWVRLIEPQQKNEQEYWVEAWPKGQQDAANYKLVQVVIDAKRFLPKALIVYPPNFDAKQNPERHVYQFSDVERNQALLQKVRAAIFQQQFIDVQPPSDWRVIRQQAPAEGATPRMAQPGRQNRNPKR